MSTTKLSVSGAGQKFPFWEGRYSETFSFVAHAATSPTVNTVMKPGPAQSHNVHAQPASQQDAKAEAIFQFFCNAGISQGTHIATGARPTRNSQAVMLMPLS